MKRTPVTLREVNRRPRRDIQPEPPQRKPPIDWSSLQQRALGALRNAKPEQIIPGVLIALALAAFIGYFVIYNMYAYALFKFPFDYDQGEGFELVDTLLFSQGRWPYRSNDSYPFYSSNYPPVFHLAKQRARSHLQGTSCTDNVHANLRPAPLAL